MVKALLIDGDRQEGEAMARAIQEADSEFFCDILSTAPALSELLLGGHSAVVCSDVPPFDAAALCRALRGAGDKRLFVAYGPGLSGAAALALLRLGADDAVLSCPDGAHRGIVAHKLSQLRLADAVAVERERRFRQFFDELPLAAQLFDKDGFLTKANRAHERLWGIKAEKHIGKYNIFKDRQLIEKGLVEHLRRAFAGEAVTLPDHEYDPGRGRCLFGRPRWLSTRAYPVRYVQGLASRVVMLQEDITDRKLAEEELKTSRAFLDNIINNCRDPIFVKDDKHRWIVVNDAFCELLGRGRDELVGKSDFDVLSPVEAELFWKRDTEVLNGGGPIQVEETLTGPGGVRRVLSTHKSLFVSDRGKIIICTLRDVTELTRSLEALRFQEERFQEALRVSKTVLYRLDVKADHYEYLSPYAEEVSGHSLERLKADGLEETLGRIHPDDREGMRRVFAQAQEIGRHQRDVSVNLEYRFVRGDGQYLWMSDWATLLFSPAGTWEAMVGSVFNITELKLAEEELRKHRNHLEELVAERTSDLETANLKLIHERDARQKIQERVRSLGAKIAVAEKNERERIAFGLHDGLAQDLAFCKMGLQALRQGSCGGPAVQEALGRQIEVLSAAIEKIRSLVFELYPPVLSELGFEAAAHWLANLFHDKYGLDCEVELGPDTLDLQDNQPEILFNAVRESLANVVKHAQAGKARLRIAREDGHAVVVVSDNGRGFDLANSDPLTSEARGFGLFNIRQQVEGGGGSVDIDTAPGQGATLSFRLPLASPPSRHTA